MKAVAQVCFSMALAMFCAGVMMDRGSAGFAITLGLALQALGLLAMTMRR